MSDFIKRRLELGGKESIKKGLSNKFDFKKLSTKSGDKLMGVLKSRTSGGMKKATKYKKYLEGLKKATSGAKPLVSKAVSAAKATKYGKIALGVAGVGLAAKAYIKKKMDKSKQKKREKGVAKKYEALRKWEKSLGIPNPKHYAEGSPNPQTRDPAKRKKKTYHDKTTLAKSERHPHSRLKTQKEYKAITDSPAYKKADYHTQNKMLKKHPTTMKKGGVTGYYGGGRTNLLEQLGRVEGERSNPNRRAEISRVHSELNRGFKKGGVPGYTKGKGIDLAKKHKTKLKDKIATGVGYATEMAKSVPSPNNPYLIIDQAKKAVSKFKKKRFEKKAKAARQAAREVTDIFSGGRKGKPHSSPEGRKASAGRTIKRMIANRKKSWPVDKIRVNPRRLEKLSKKTFSTGGSITVKTKIGKFFPTKTY